jgi:transposase
MSWERCRPMSHVPPCIREVANLPHLLGEEHELILQCMENDTDRLAAETVQRRIDWKYVLSLELTDVGFDFSVLSEFRDRITAEGIEEHLLTTLLDLCQERHVLKAQGKQHTDSTHVLAAIRTINRLECVG